MWHSNHEYSGFLGWTWKIPNSFLSQLTWIRYGSKKAGWHWCKPRTYMPYFPSNKEFMSWYCKFHWNQMRIRTQHLQFCHLLLPTDLSVKLATWRIPEEYESIKIIWKIAKYRHSLREIYTFSDLKVGYLDKWWGYQRETHTILYHFLRVFQWYQISSSFSCQTMSGFPQSGELLSCSLYFINEHRD